MTAIPDQFWSQQSADVDGSPDDYDGFGTAVWAGGDFNGDGVADLASGIPRDVTGSGAAIGGVTVLYGSSGGLSATTIPDQLWSQASIFVQDWAEADDFFGFSLATGG